MLVYIEYVLIDNIVITYMLLVLTSKSVGINVTRLKMFVISFISSIATIILPILNLNLTLCIIYKIFLAIIIILLLNSLRCLHQIITSFFAFITFTFVFGGLIYAIFDVFQFDYNVSNILILGFEIPISTIVLPIYVYFIVVKKFIKYFKNKQILNEVEYVIKIKINNEVWTFKCMVDSGNSLIDPLFKLPISIISGDKLNLKRNYSDKFNYAWGENCECNKSILSEPNHKVSISTINGNSEIAVYRLNNVNLYKGGKLINVLSPFMVGISDEKIGKYDCLLNPRIL